MIDKIVKERKAQLLPLAIVLMFMLGIGTAAFFLTESFGSGITGYATLSSSDCGTELSTGSYTLDGSIDCGSDVGLSIVDSDVTLDCRGNTISGNGGFGILIMTNVTTGTTDSVLIKNCTIEDFDVAINVTTIPAAVSTAITDLNITKNTLDGGTYDLGFEEDGDGITANIWLNNFEDNGVGGTASSLDFCIYENTGGYEDVVGNFYASATPVATGCTDDYRKSLPSAVVDGIMPLLCGANVTGALTLIDDLHDWTSSSDTKCDGAGLILDSSSAVLDCSNTHTIRGDTTGTGIQFSDNADGAEVKDCIITNFSVGVNISHGGDADLSGNNINATSVAVKVADGATVEITNNLLYGITDDLNVSDASIDLDVFSNSFWYSGINDSGDVGDYCIDDVGNFYVASIADSAIPNSDCSLPGFSTIVQGGDYEGESLFINWNETGAASTVTYHLNFYNTTPGDVLWQSPTPFTDSFYSWSITNILNGTFKVKLTPESGGVNSSSAIVTISISNDDDGDGFSGVDHSDDAWDCNDENSSIHQPINRENSTNPAVSNFCYDAVDDDCDDDIDWLDDGCGGGFDPGSFNNSYYINGSFQDIEATPSALIMNQYGKIVLSGNTNLSGVNLGSIFSISHDSIGANEEATDFDRINKSATITFFNLVYNKLPVILVDGVPCELDVCTYLSPAPENYPESFDGNLSFTSSHFSTYSTTNNSRMITFTQNESEAAGISSEFPKQISTYQRVKFWANYTKYPSGDAINNLTSGIKDQANNGTCNITIFRSGLPPIIIVNNSAMTYNEYDEVYWFETGITNFTFASDYYRYNISCESDLYEPMNASAQFSVETDTEAPIAPILYKQIELYPSNVSDTKWTNVSGYFNESDINYTIMVLHSFWAFQINGTSSTTTEYSEYKGPDDVVVNFDSDKGQNVTFVNWTQERERALNSFEYVEFSGHNRTYFKRYHIVEVNRTGNDIRIAFDEDLEQDVTIGDKMHLFTARNRSGYFIEEIPLFSGTNRITVWGVDTVGNPGFASEDWIVAPFADTAPGKPDVWDFPEAAMYNDTDFDIVGIINESYLLNLNMTTNFIQNYYFKIFWNDSSYEHSLERALCPLASTPDVPAGNNFFYVDDVYYYDTFLSTINFTSDNIWVEFDNHNRTYWRLYNVTNVTKNPGEDYRLYVNPPLEVGVNSSVTTYYYNNSYPNGWFNVTVNLSEVLTNGSHSFYALAIRNSTDEEGPQSETQSIYLDPEYPTYDLSGVPNYSATRTPTLTFNVSDDFKVNISSLLVNISNSTWNSTYAYDSSYFAYNILQNISCADTFSNGSSYGCSFTANRTENGTYNITFSFKDLAGWETITRQNLSIIRTEIDIDEVDDQDDITNDLWMYFNWTYSPIGGELDYFEFALGNDTYPNEGYDSYKNWTSTCNSSSSCTENSVNITHDMNVSDHNASEIKMKSGRIYYLSVRAKNLAGEYGAYGYTDGILFIDQTPPYCFGINASGEFTMDADRLSANWTFADNESDILRYQYAIGTGVYPNSSYSSLMEGGAPITTSLDDWTHTGVSLVDGETYYWNVKAFNGNSAMNFSGSWSPWCSSPGITVDLSNPYGGSINWTGNVTDNTGNITVHYNTGTDDTSGPTQGRVQIGSSPLVNNECTASISDFDWANSSDYLPSGQSSRELNLTTGYCYVFRLDTWDRAGRHTVYTSENETAKIVRSDQTPPTDVAPVVDEGFYTNNRDTLYASWQTSSDYESGLKYYVWRILEQDIASGSCTIDTDDPANTDCMPIANGTTLSTFANPTSLNLTHNNKYYFEVYAENNAYMNSTKRYSNGIIYLDNAPPAAVTVTNVSDDNSSSDGWVSELRSGWINITGYGDLDGYQDIQECYLQISDLDFIGDTTSDQVLSQCSISRVSSYTENVTELTGYIDQTITKVECVNRTNYTGGDYEGEARQFNALNTPQNLTWYVSCKDTYENKQSYAQNTHVVFSVDWPEPPVFVSHYVSPPIPYSDDDLSCYAIVSDPENDLNVSFANVSWLIDDVLYSNTTVSLTNTDGNNYRTPEVDLDSSVTARGMNITCSITVFDQYPNQNNSNVSVEVWNTPVSTNAPNEHLFMLQPGEDRSLNYFNNNMSFWWRGAAQDDVDYDFYTYTLRVDDEGDVPPEFNYSNNPPLSFYPAQEMKVGGISIPGIQRNADVYRNKVVYEDNRAGNWDIYMYDFDTDVETVVTTNALDQYNPQIYNDFILYEQNISAGYSSVYKYTLSTSSKTLLVSSIVENSLDYFGKYIVYQNTSGIVYQNIVDGGSPVLISGSANAGTLSMYGTHITWIGSFGEYHVYDTVNEQETSVGASYEDIALFGSKRVLEVDSSNVISVSDMVDSGYTLSLRGENISLYGGLLAYENTSGIVVTDILVNRTGANISVGPGSNPALYDKLLVYEYANNLWYAHRNLTLPATWIVEDPIDSNFYALNTNTTNNTVYAWMIQVCDSSFANNSCTWGSDNNETWPVKNYTLFTVDNQAPTIYGISPTNNSVITGYLQLWANIIDNTDDFVYDANYSVVNSSNPSQLMWNGTLTADGNTWYSDHINFSVFDEANFTMLIAARDYLNNTAVATTYFVANNDTPWFVFGTGADEINVSGRKTFNDTIRSNFTAYTVTESTLNIYGPLPGTATRFLESMLNLTVTNHDYSDDISTLTWPDGKYRVVFEGTNYDFSPTDNRTFFVDHTSPYYYDQNTIPSTVYASQTFNISINWSDTTLTSANLTYNNSNSSNPTQYEQSWDNNYASDSYDGSRIFSQEVSDVSGYINTTYNWTFTAIDGYGRTNTTSYGVFVQSTPPSFSGTIANVNINEDTWLVNTSNLSIDLSDYFSDADTLDSVYGHLDNLTYNVTSYNENVTVVVNALTGIVESINATGNFSGNATVIFNVTDYYGVTNVSNNVTIVVAQVNDAPYFNTTISNVTIEEDNVSGFAFNLSDYALDVEGETVYWDADIGNESIVRQNYSDGLGNFNFSLVPNRYGELNITFTITDNNSASRSVDVFINVTSVEDFPTQPAVTNITTGGYTPNISSKVGDFVYITWNESTDGDSYYGDTISYNINYTNETGTYSVAVGETNTTYRWNTSANITDPQDLNITVQAVDTTSRSNTSEAYGEFTVDNSGPVITIDWPLLITVGTWFLTDVTTDEDAICTFSSPNSTVTFNSTQTKDTSLGQTHVVNVSSNPTWTYNTTLQLNVTCVDEADNSASATRTFEPRATALEFVTAYATPNVTYAGQNVNITIVVATNETLTGNFNIILPDTTPIAIDTANNFSNEINASVKEASLNAPFTTAQTGNYNFTVDSIDNPSVPTQGTDIPLGTILTIYPPVNQTLASTV